MIASRPSIDYVRWQRVLDLFDLHRHLRVDDPERARLVWDAWRRLLLRMCGEDDRRGVRESVPKRHHITDFDRLYRVGYFEPVVYR